MKTVASLFSGGGGWEIGATAAGFTPIWAVEHDPAIAEVYAANIGAHVIAKDAQEVDPSTLESPNLLVVSPPCQNDSTARSKNLPRRKDADVGLCVLDHVRILRPEYFFLENVEGYKRNKTYKKIFDGLHGLGYFVNVQVLNAADFGVPQTRRRLILRASRLGWLPPLPAPTPWLGWYQAIEDLVPRLPESRFADWQLKRLDAGLLKGMNIESEFFIGGANKSQAFLDFAIENRASIPGIRNASEPMSTVPADVAAFSCGRAFIVRPTDQLESVNVARDCSEPIWTLTEGNTAHGRVKAFLVGDQNSHNGKSILVRDGHEPAGTVDTRPSAKIKGFIVDGRPANYAGDLQIIESDRPVVPVTATQTRHPFRAWLSQGRVVAMTVRALARFQSFPDSYIFPEGKGATGLGCKIVGNAVPPEMSKRLTEGLSL